MAAAYLDDRLVGLLKANMLEDKAVISELFGSRGPFGSFATRIESAYALGLVGQVERRDLHILRKIRNDFGHIATPLAFIDGAIADRARSLRLHGLDHNSPPRRYFERSTMALASRIDVATIRSTRPTPAQSRVWSEQQLDLLRKVEGDMEVLLSQWHEAGDNLDQMRERVDELLNDLFQKLAAVVEGAPDTASGGSSN